MSNEEKVPKFIKELTIPKATKRAGVARSLAERVRPSEIEPLAPPKIQLELFLDTQVVDDKGDRSWQYSNILALWDQLPKGKAYNSSSPTASTLVTTIDFEGTTLIVEQNPAQMKKFIKGVETVEFVYPSKAEDKILDAIRYICTESKEIAYSETSSAYTFKFITHQIYQHLKRRNETHSHAQIKRSLDILNKSHLAIYNADKTEVIQSTLINNLYMNTGKHIGKITEEDALIVLQMHALFTYAVKQGQYLPYNYDLTKDLGNGLAVLIYRIMAIEFRNAETTISFVIDTEKTIAKSMFSTCKSLSANKKKMVAAIDELKSKNIIASSEPKDRYGANGRIIESKFVIFPTQMFTQAMIDSNKLNVRRTGIRAKSSLKSLKNS